MEPSLQSVCLDSSPAAPPSPSSALSHSTCESVNVNLIKSSAETSKLARPGAGCRTTQPGLDSGSRETSALLSQTLSPLLWPLPAWLLRVWYPLGVTFSSHQVSCQHLQAPKTHPWYYGWPFICLSHFFSQCICGLCVCAHVCACVCRRTAPCIRVWR